MIRGLPLHPVLATAAFVLFFWTHNHFTVDATQAAPVLAVAVGAAAGLQLVATALVRDRVRGALVATLLVAAAFFYGPLVDAAGDAWPDVPMRVVQAGVGAGEAMAVVLLVGGLRRARRPGRVTQAVTVASLLWLAASARVQLSAWRPAGEGVALAALPPRAVAPAGAPDIYFIVLDGYARADVLRRVHGFDDGPFLGELRRRGFWIADRATANYPLTFLSLAATLDMDLLSDVVAAAGPAGHDQAPVVARLRRHAVGRFLQARGYRYVHFRTNYGPTEGSDIADEIVTPPSLWPRTEFAGFVLRATPLRLLEPSVAALYLHAFATLRAMPGSPTPTFTFCHLTVPHHPYVFDRDGTVRADVPLGRQFSERVHRDEDAGAYLAQLEFVNAAILRTIDAILARSPRPPVILLQSDHGTARTMGDRRRSEAEWGAFARERLSTLSAWLVPEVVRARLRPDVSSVNTFRILFAALFGADLPELPDRAFLSRAMYDRPYQLEDVTALVHGEPTPADGPGPMSDKMDYVNSGWALCR